SQGVTADGAMQSIEMESARQSRSCMAEVDTEDSLQPAMSGRRHLDGAFAALLRHPAELEHAATDRGADEARDVISPLAPVEARAAEDSPPCAPGIERDPERPEEPFAVRRDGAAILIQQQMPPRRHRVSDGDAEMSGEVVVTGAGKAQRVVAGR